MENGSGVDGGGGSGGCMSMGRECLGVSAIPVDPNPNLFPLLSLSLSV